MTPKNKASRNKRIQTIKSGKSGADQALKGKIRTIKQKIMY
jgi:hypothetical protein